VQVLDVDDLNDLKGRDKLCGIVVDNKVFCEQFIGRVGRIVEEKIGGEMPVGNNNRDPLYVVEVPGLGRDGFWGEELKKIG
jgi:hypothetical protein